MTVTINLPRNLEGRLRARAEKMGVEASEYVIKSLENDLSREDSTGLVRLSAERTRLLHDMNAGLSAETWERYHELTQKRRDEHMTPKEYRELIKLSDVVEGANVRRLEAAIDYATRHGKKLEDIMRKFKIGRVADV